MPSQVALRSVIDSGERCDAGKGSEMAQDTVLTEELERTRRAWDGIAAGFDRYVTPTGDWALPEEALDLAAVTDGTRFLDVASGSGALSLPAARRGAEVTAIDLSPAMIERLHARARDEGLDNVAGRVMDGHALTFDDGSFDVVGSQFGVMLFPDLPRGLGEMVRVTRPGGRVVVVAFAQPSKVEFLTFFVGALRAVIPGFTGLPTDPPPLPFQVADPRRLQEEMTAAGLASVTIEPRTEHLRITSADHLWEWVTNSNPIGAGLVADLDDDQRVEVLRVLDGMLRERSGGDPKAELNAQVHVAVGRKATSRSG